MSLSAILPVVLCLVGVLGSQRPPPQPPEKIFGCCTEVHDGDSFVVRTSDGKEYRVELRGVDAPELGQPYGAEAHAKLSEFVLNCDVEVQPRPAFEGEEQIVGYVRSGDEEINAAMLREGLGWQIEFYPNGVVSTGGPIARFEREAKKNGFGLWAQENPCEPRRWRESTAVDQEFIGEPVYRIMDCGAIPEPQRLEGSDPAPPEKIAHLRHWGPTLDLVIGPDGQVLDAIVFRSGGPGDSLDEVGVHAAKQWIFQGSLLCGRPVHVVLRLRVSSLDWHP